MVGVERPSFVKREIRALKNSGLFVWKVIQASGAFLFATSRMFGPLDSERRILYEAFDEGRFEQMESQSHAAASAVEGNHIVNLLHQLPLSHNPNTPVSSVLSESVTVTFKKEDWNWNKRKEEKK